MTADVITPWLDRWGLVPDGEPFSTRFGSRLAPVRHLGAPAMLKIAGHDEERRGGALIEWWGGAGAARVLNRAGDAILLERALGPRSLAAMALGGRDVLHGDLHHDNVLDGDDRGWLAIDPKGLIGERSFDHANLFRTPTAELALAPGVTARRMEVVAEAARLDPVRLLSWIFAYAALGAAWSLQSGDDPQPGLAIARMAAGRLGVAV